MTATCTHTHRTSPKPTGKKRSRHVATDGESYRRREAVTGGASSYRWNTCVGAVGQGGQPTGPSNWGSVVLGPCSWPDLVYGHRPTFDDCPKTIRGRQVKDNNGDGIGKVADLLVENREENVRFLLIEHGGFLGFGETKTLIPVDAITKITEYDVYVEPRFSSVIADHRVDEHRC